MDIFEKDKRIEHQNFDAAIIVGIVTLMLFYAYHFLPEQYKSLELLAAAISNIIFWFSFRRYLLNFSSTAAIYWVNWNIGLIMALTVGLQVFELSKDLFTHAHIKEHVALGSIVFLLMFFLFAISAFACFRLGVALQKMNDDFIGLLKQLGQVYCYLEAPLIYFIAVVAPFLKFLKNNLPYHLILDTLSGIPIAILIVIYLRAKKFRREQYPL